MKILVIDDWSCTADNVRHLYPMDKVDHLFRIPEDLSVLDNYDVLIVDNEGIGNSTYKSGKSFLKDYEPKSEDQAVIFHSGLSPDSEFKWILDNKNFYSFTKGQNPDKLRNLINEIIPLSKRNPYELHPNEINV